MLIIMLLKVEDRGHDPWGGMVASWLVQLSPEQAVQV